MTTERLYTPWRMKYVSSTRKKKKGCVFCNTVAEKPQADRQNYLIYRGELTFAIMNIYPYNTGHLMLLPYAHLSTLAEVPFDAQVELMALTSYFTESLSQVVRPDGFNIGINLGSTAGAGIDSHLHIHVVPRWKGDSNFMPVIGETRVLPEELGDTYDKIVAFVKKHPPELPTV